MHVEYVNHASLLVTTSRGKLLTDPYLMMAPWEEQTAIFFPPRRIPFRSWGRLRWVFISHVHSDHAHAVTLAALQHSGQLGRVLIPQDRPELCAFLARLGLSSVTELPPGIRTRLAPGVWASVVLHPGGIDSTLVFHGDGQTLAACSDCILPPEDAARVSELAPLDVAFVPHTTVQDLHPFVLGLPPPQLRLLAKERERQDMERLLSHAHNLNARLTVPYAYTVAYRRKEQDHLNRWGRTLPFEFERAFSKRYADRQCRVMWPGDRMQVLQRSFRHQRSHRRVPKTRAAFFQALRQQCAARPPPAWPDVAPRQVAPIVVRHFTRALLSPAFLFRLRGKCIQLELTGAGAEQHWTLPLGGDAAVPGTALEPVLVIRMPAALIAPILDGTHDPYMALYTYRVRLRWSGLAFSSARMATEAALELFVYLFTATRADVV